MYVVTSGMMAARGKLFNNKRPVVGDDIILSPWNVLRHYSIHTLSYTHTTTLTYKSLIAVLEDDDFPVVSKIIRSSAMRMLLLRTVIGLASELNATRARIKAEEAEMVLVSRRDSGEIDLETFENKRKMVRRQSFNGLEDVFGRNVHEKNKRKRKKHYD